MKTSKFQLFKSEKDNQFYWRLRAKNSEIILCSEGYKTKKGAENGIESVRKNSPFDERYDRREAQNGEYYFVLKAANHEIIGVSETYKTKAGRDKGIKVVKREAPCAPLEDLTNKGSQRQDTAKAVGTAEASGSLVIFPKSKKCDDGLHARPKGGSYGEAHIF